MKVSFDYDSTLSEDYVEDYAKTLVDDGHEVWLVTSRLGNGKEPNPHWNDDLYECASRVGISKEHIYFCSMANKSEFLKDKGFLWHLDDDVIELSFIRTDTDVFPIYHNRGNGWRLYCDDLIRIVSIYEERTIEEY